MIRDIREPTSSPLLNLPALVAGACAAAMLLPAPSRAQHMIAAVDGDTSFPSMAPKGYGEMVAGLGDVDGDGVPDIALKIAQGTASAQVPGARIISGADGHTLAQWLAPEAFSNWHYGTRFAEVGDVDGDGKSDLGVGIRFTAPQLPGTCWIHSGADGQILLTLQMSAAPVYYSSMTGMGDVDHDGHADIAMCVNGWQNLAFPRVALFSGANGAVLRTLDDASLMPTNVLGPGDIDGDGTPDLVLATESGDVLAWSGAALVGGQPAVPLWASHFTPSYLVEDFASDMDSTGDIDADGRPDFVFGTDPLTSLEVGQVVVVSGASGTPLWTLTGPTLSHFGKSVAGPGDMNGDGTPDVAIGQGSFTKDRSVRLYSGSDAAVLATIHPENWNGPWGNGFGDSVCRVGDIDGDGRADIAAGAPQAAQAASGSALGRLYVFGLGGSWTWLNSGMAGTVGIPVLLGHGEPSPNATLKLVLQRALPNALGYLVVGASALNKPFMGGTLVPAKDVVIPFVTDAQGGVEWDGRWPSLLPSGLALYLQTWLPDTGGEKGWLASSAQQVVAP